jgi:alanine racemase
MSIKSHVGRVRTLPAGSSVGYGRSYVCERPTQVALIPVGYGDLYHRVLSNKGMVLVGGRSAPVIGRISMDQTMVDVSAVPGVQEGDEAVLIGGQGDETITADDLAAIAETINYEVTTSVLPRVPRVFVRGGAVVEVLR